MSCKTGFLRNWVNRVGLNVRPSCSSVLFFNPKTEREPRMTRIDMDDEEVVEMIPKPVWGILKSVQSVVKIQRSPASALWSLVSSSNANGVASLSPGLRSRDRYPGSSCHPMLQPQRGCVPCAAAPAPTDGTALRFNMFAAPLPRVGLIAFGQPLG